MTVPSLKQLFASNSLRERIGRVGMLSESRLGASASAYPGRRAWLFRVLTVEFKNDPIVASQVRGWLPGRLVMFPLDLVHQSVLWVSSAVHDFLKFPLLNDLIGPIFPFQDPTSDVA